MLNRPSQTSADGERTIAMNRPCHAGVSALLERGRWFVTAALLAAGCVAACQGDQNASTEGSWTVAPELVGEWRVDAPSGVLLQPVSIEFGADARLEVAGQTGSGQWGVGRRVNERMRIDVMLPEGPGSWWGTLSPDGNTLQLDALPGVWLRRAAAVDDRAEE